MSAVERVNEKRWQVERRDDSLEDVGADFMEIHPSGALIFTSGKRVDEFPSGAPIVTPVVVIAYAPGQWHTVFEDDES